MPTTLSAKAPCTVPAIDTARRTLYRFTSLALLDPLGGTWPQLTDGNSKTCVESACELLREETAGAIACLGLGELPRDRLDPAIVFARMPVSPAALNEQYERTFGLLTTSACPPCETEYVDGKLSFQRAQQLADIAGYYRAFGVEPGAERPDHIALELEFMALLIDLESRAGTKDQLDVSRDAQVRFVQDHLAWWLPVFARLLHKEAPGSFFAAVGDLLCAFLPTERARLGVETPVHRAAPSPIERPEECEGCALHSL
jgi:TorA maturation chaperone TorD